MIYLVKVKFEDPFTFKIYTRYYLSWQLLIVIIKKRWLITRPVLNVNTNFNKTATRVTNILQKLFIIKL